jgi:hypothetical protein
MDFLLALILLAAVMAVLAYPIIQTRPRAVLSTGNALNELLAQRDGLYATLRDLDLDYELGKLDGGDYQARRERYVARAALVLQQLDALRSTSTRENSLSDEIEREVAALRRPKAGSSRQHLAIGTRRLATPSESGTRRTSASARVPPRGFRAVRSPRSTSTLTCPDCGRPYKDGDRFCGRCGHALN